MIGLKRHTVKVVPHNPIWKEIYAQREKFLYELLKDYIVEIQHIGSTSIPALPAKPILDIAIAIKEPSFEDKCISRLKNFGYDYRGNAGKNGGHVLVRCSKPDVRTEHIHLLLKEDAQWANYLNFRDYLKCHPALFQAYAQLKADLAIKHFDNRANYTQGKIAFINSVFAQIESENFISDSL